jgi:hypothetical protein
VADLSPDELSQLRPYVINLNQGRFSTGGKFQTSQADVDAIFEEHIPAAITRAGAKPLTMAIYAHGGLVSEESGLMIAHGQIQWWLSNGVYPVHFVWETGFLDALKQVVGDVAGRRDIWDFTTDPVIEDLARPLGGRLWLAMKRSAELASQPDGGAHYFAERLARFCEDDPAALVLHAIGHSAGAIFHAHFLPAAKKAGVPSAVSLQLLAPAVRVDVFKERLVPLMGSAGTRLVVFTMKRELERADNCISVYHKSLLYLIRRALEPESEADILGLEDSIRSDAMLMELFCLDRRGGQKPTVAWSMTDNAAPLNLRTASTSHGGFDNDSMTMTSVARNVTGRDDVKPLPVATRAVARELWTDAGTSREALTTAPFVPAVGGGARRALCVGINEYPSPNGLLGCVADAEAWAGSLSRLGFTTELIRDAEATRSGIIERFTALLATSQPGDVLVFQYSGHGTEVPDLNSDETAGTNGPKDEAMCPVDFADGRLLLDDDLRELIGGLPDGVNLTVLADCCHSGTITRALALGGGAMPQSVGMTMRARFVWSTPELVTAHKAFRESRPAPASAGREGETMRETTFSACLDREVAYESDGHGEFTRNALTILDSDLAGLTNEGFVERVIEAFGPARRQTPQLDAADTFGAYPFLGPLASTAARKVTMAETTYNRHELSRLLRTAADALEVEGPRTQTGLVGDRRR